MTKGLAVGQNMVKFEIWDTGIKQLLLAQSTCHERACIGQLLITLLLVLVLLLLLLLLLFIT
jgi:hypothetical protein